MATDDEDDYKATTQPQGPLPQLELMGKHCSSRTHGEPLFLEELMGNHGATELSFFALVEPGAAEGMTSARHHYCISMTSQHKPIIM